MQNPNTLYHYCSTEAAVSILSSQTLRLTALSGANDSLEGRVLGQAFYEALTKTDLPQGVQDFVSIVVESFPDHTDGFAFCLSEQPDLLSQWRAYGADGCGVALGFDPITLNADLGTTTFGKTCFDLVKIEYSYEAALNAIEATVSELEQLCSGHGEFISLKAGITKEQAKRQISEQGPDNGQIFDFPSLNKELVLSLLDLTSTVHFKSYQFKPSAFSEEREWRLLRYRHRASEEHTQFAARHNSIRPFVETNMPGPPKSPLKEIILGPKHQSDFAWMRYFLNANGLGHVEVKLSHITSYR